MSHCLMSQNGCKNAVNTRAFRRGWDKPKEHEREDIRQTTEILISEKQIRTEIFNESIKMSPCLLKSLSHCKEGQI